MTYDSEDKHRHCPDENGGCYFADEPNCTPLNPHDEDYAELYKFLRDHWEQFSGNTWREPIGPKLDDAIRAAIAKARA